MRYRFERLLALALTASFATLGSAQANTPNQSADSGFFRPSPDPNLTGPQPNERTRPTEALVAEDKTQAAEGNPVHERPPEALDVMRWSEQQMDRSEQEAEKAKPQPGSPQPINGAFTGQTDERSR